MDSSEKAKDDTSESADQLSDQGKGIEGEKPLPKKKLEWEENPDLEDPRLFSPLQAPDTPDPQERIHDESEQGQTPSEGAREASECEEG